MANEFSIEIKGLKEVQKALYSYSQQLGDRVIVGALKEGAKVVQKEAKRRAPKSSGRLRSGIVVKKSHLNKASHGVIGVYLALRKGKGKKDRKDAFYGRFQEDGWNVRGKDREELGRKYGRMQYKGRGTINNTFGKRRGRMSMPGKRDVPGKRFIKGAFESKRMEAIRVIVAAAERGAEIVKHKVGLR